MSTVTGVFHYLKDVLTNRGRNYITPQLQQAQQNHNSNFHHLVAGSTPQAPRKKSPNDDDDDENKNNNLHDFTPSTINAKIMTCCDTSGSSIPTTTTVGRAEKQDISRQLELLFLNHEYDEDNDDHNKPKRMFSVSSSSSSSSSNSRTTREQELETILESMHDHSLQDNIANLQDQIRKIKNNNNHHDNNNDDSENNLNNEEDFYYFHLSHLLMKDRNEKFLYLSHQLHRQLQTKDRQTNPLAQAVYTAEKQEEISNLIQEKNRLNETLKEHQDLRRNHLNNSFLPSPVVPQASLMKNKKNNTFNNNQKKIIVSPPCCSEATTAAASNQNRYFYDSFRGIIGKSQTRSFVADEKSSSSSSSSSSSPDPQMPSSCSSSQAMMLRSNHNPNNNDQSILNKNKSQDKKSSSPAASTARMLHLFTSEENDSSLNLPRKTKKTSTPSSVLHDFDDATHNESNNNNNNNEQQKQKQKSRNSTLSLFAFVLYFCVVFIVIYNDVCYAPIMKHDENSSEPVSMVFFHQISTAMMKFSSFDFWICYVMCFVSNSNTINWMLLEFYASGYDPSLSTFSAEHDRISVCSYSL